MRRVFTIALAAAVLAGCGDSGERVDFGGDDLGPDVHGVLSEDGNVKLGLTREWVYFALSDSARAEARAELDGDAEGSFFGGIMRNLVGRALDFRAKYAVAEIRDIRWEDGEMRIEFEDPERQVDSNLQIGEDESVTEAFDEAAIRSFGEAFRELKAGGM